MFSRQFTQPGSLARITVTLKADGWELSRETSDGAIERSQYRDWHRVEFALRSIGVDQSSFVTAPTDPSAS